MTKWHVCFAHTIHQTHEKQTSKKQTICKQTKQTICNSRAKTHKSKTNRKTNKQETHGILYRNLFRFFVRKAMLKQMTKWLFCYAHTIHQTNEKQTSRKQTITMPKCLVCNGNTSNLYKKLHVTCFVF